VYPLLSLWNRNQPETMPMMLSLYVMLGIFLLVAVRDPSANRSLIDFTAWSSFAHAAVIAVQSFQSATERGHLLVGVAVLGIIGVALLALSPPKLPRCVHSIEFRESPNQAHRDATAVRPNLHFCRFVALPR
jgi:hypothetical protein